MISFKPEDFAQGMGFAIQEANANFVNRRLQELVDSWPVVYANLGTPNVKPLAPAWYEMTGMPYVTHKARLAFIEEIKKEPCKHEPRKLLGTDDCFYFQCKHCGIDLQATWSEKK